MNDDKVPTIIYAGASALLGMITLIAALIWRSGTNSDSSTTVSGFSSISTAPVGIISSILVLAGTALIIWSILFFLVRSLRKKTIHGGEIPTPILQKEPDESLQQPLS